MEWNESFLTLDRHLQLFGVGNIGSMGEAKSGD
jgi:hypothetical protein